MVTEKELVNRVEKFRSNVFDRIPLEKVRIMKTDPGLYEYITKLTNSNRQQILSNLVTLKNSWEAEVGPVLKRLHKGNLTPEIALVRIWNIIEGKCGDTTPLSIHICNTYFNFLVIAQFSSNLLIGDGTYIYKWSRMLTKSYTNSKRDMIERIDPQLNAIDYEYIYHFEIGSPTGYDTLAPGTWTLSGGVEIDKIERSLLRVIVIYQEGDKRVVNSRKYNPNLVFNVNDSNKLSFNGDGWISGPLNICIVKYTPLSRYETKYTVFTILKNVYLR